MLAACASTDEAGGKPAKASEIAWAQREGANLSADKAECQRTANDIDPNSPKEFTDGRYGAAAALASRLDHESVKGGTVQRMRDAVFQDCMVRKGWTPK